MYDQSTQIVIALAGVCQAVNLVQSFARKGVAAQSQFETSIKSIVITDPDSTEQVFGSLADLQLGLQTLIAQLGNVPVEKDAEITRYVASVLGLERKLSRQPKRLSELSSRIAGIERQLQHLNLFEDQMISNLASIYSDVLSPAGPKIQIAGTPALLQQASIQHRVRALLLAALRAAVLWRQLGGKRRSILFNRRKIVAIAQQLLQQTNQ